MINLNQILKKLTIIIMMLGFTALAQPAIAQSFVDSTCYKYFEMTAKLKQGDSLSKADWKAFLSDKAIKDYMTDQGVDDRYLESYRKNMEIVYMPKNEALLQKRLKEPNSYWLTYMINQYKVDEEGMKNYLKTIKADPASYFEKSYEYAFSALPKRAHRKLPDLKVAIIPIHNDAHAQDDLVIYTLLCAYKNDMNRLGALGGHELHHMLRPMPTFEVEPDEKTAVMAMHWVLNEGSADMVDKKHMTDTARKLMETQRYFPVFFNEAKKVLPRLDSLFQLDGKVWKTLRVKEYFKGTQFANGHVPGQYMSHYIEKNGLKGKLMESIDDPFSFFLIYHKASKKDKEKPFRFSNTAIKNIQSLKRKYVDVKKA